MSRTYDSPVRDARRDETRARIVAAAGALFAEHGYAATTVRQIADRAGVSVERVASVGPKSALLVAAYDRAVDDGAEPGLLDRAEIRGPLDAHDRDATIRALADFFIDSTERSRALWAAWVEASRSTPDLAESYAARMAEMRGLGQRVVATMVGVGIVDAAVDGTAAADEVWAVGHPANHELLVVLAGWTTARYRRWLIDCIDRVLPPPAPT